jgi:hypothetical protein
MQCLRLPILLSYGSNNLEKAKKRNPCKDSVKKR